MKKLRLVVWVRSTLCYVATVVLGLCCPIFAQGDRCNQPTEALASSDWQSIKPSHFPVEVMFSNPAGWIGVDRVLEPGNTCRRDGQRRSVSRSNNGSVVRRVEHLTPVHNPSPVFYLHATEIASFFSPFDADKIRLLRLKVRHGHRELRVSKGITKHICGGISQPFSRTDRREAAIPDSDGVKASGPTCTWPIPHCDRKSGKRRFRV